MQAVLCNIALVGTGVLGVEVMETTSGVEPESMGVAVESVGTAGESMGAAVESMGAAVESMGAAGECRGGSGGYRVAEGDGGAPAVGPTNGRVGVPVATLGLV